MLNHIPRRIPPVIKNLRSQNVPPNAPHSLIPLIRKPLVAQFLGIEVVDLERTVMHVRGWVRGHEKGVVVDVGGAAVDVCEEGDVFLAVGGCGVGGVDVKEVAGGDVEGAGVEVDEGVEFGGADAVVAEL